MFDVLVRLLRPSANPPPPAGVDVLTEIADAEFAWLAKDGIRCWPIAVTSRTMTTRPNGSSEVHLAINRDGLRATAVVVDDTGQTLVYLANDFWVADELKRNGLATGMVLALARVAQLAAPQPTLDKPIVLEGFFMGQGVRFAEGVCVTRPSKEHPAALRCDVLERAQLRLTATTPPVAVRRWSPQG